MRVGNIYANPRFHPTAMEENLVECAQPLFGTKISLKIPCYFLCREFGCYRNECNVRWLSRWITGCDVSSDGVGVTATVHDVVGSHAEGQCAHSADKVNDELEFSVFIPDPAVCQYHRIYDEYRKTPMPREGIRSFIDPQTEYCMSHWCLWSWWWFYTLRRCV